ncbi:MAG: hypothetical protein RLZZ240_281 [Actinomycetota bacterium]
MIKNKALAGITVVAALLLAACSQGTSDTATTADEGTVAEATGTKPAPFDAGPVKIAIVQNSGAGDYFQQWTIGSGVAGIIVDHGQADTMCPLINKALEAGIPVVVYDVATAECAPNAVTTQQSDASLAQAVLDQMAADLGKDAKVGYVNVLGIAPLDRRHVVWEAIVKANNWTQSFFVGKFTNSVATDNAQLVDAALKKSPDVVGIFAPYDELTKGTVSGIESNNLQASIKAYGIDISNADIEIMTKEGSPWVATAGTDPNAIGAAVVRNMALEIAGQLGVKSVDFPGVLITAQFLKDNAVKNMVDLRAKLPELNLASVSGADWIPAVQF